MIYVHFANDQERGQGYAWKTHAKTGCVPVKEIKFDLAKLQSHYNPFEQDICPICKKNLPKGYFEIG